VTIKALISSTGEPDNLEVLSPGGDPRLIRAALDAVRQWRYQPARLNGEPVAIDTQITVDFRLTP
jgi:protein TonB